MAQNLALFPFTNLSDIAISGDGWYVPMGVDPVVVDTYSGRDRIIGSSGSSDGIKCEGVINTGAGGDVIRGTFSGSYGYDGIVNLDLINTGEGSDRIFGTFIGQANTGSGINNLGMINTGIGKDKITGVGGYYGILNQGIINTGDGNDRITGIGNAVAIYTQDTFNRQAWIDTGAGRDIVNALEGGFGGDGNTYLGSGSDTLKGFGTGTFYGGSGWDKILFGQGTYTVTGSTIISAGVTMNVNEFEKIGGANGGLFKYANGTLIVNNDGVATFIE